MTTEAHTAGTVGVTMIALSLHLVDGALSLMGSLANGCPDSRAGPGLTHAANRLLADVSAAWEQLGATADQLRRVAEQVVAALVDIVLALVGG
jgi:hypothetical protein